MDRFKQRRANGEDGYILVTLILFVTLLAIAMTAMAPLVKQQVKRDREEELIHRGVQYSRAIKHYVKKFGRYPTRMEDLENTNNVRFLRKRYKDPVTGKDFKILHMGEVQAAFGPGMQGAIPAGTLAAQSGAFGGNNAFGGNSTFGGNSSFGGGNSALGGNGAFTGGNSFTSGTGSFGGNSSMNSSFGSSGSSFGAGNGANNPQPPGTAGNGQNQQDATAEGQGEPGSPNQKTSGEADAESSNKVFGGGPIVGVASVSKEKSIRVFNKKEHYYQWQFVYDPTTDRGGLISTPNQPGLQSLGGGNLQQGMQGQQPGNQNSPFGGQNSFGFQGGNSMSPSGMQASPGNFQQQQQQSPQSAFPPDQSQQ
jgi:type II secretory pathway pseudopilin PulG